MCMSLLKMFVSSRARIKNIRHHNESLSSYRQTCWENWSWIALVLTINIPSPTETAFHTHYSFISIQTQMNLDLIPSVGNLNSWKLKSFARSDLFSPKISTHLVVLSQHFDVSSPRTPFGGYRGGPEPCANKPNLWLRCFFPCNCKCSSSLPASRSLEWVSATEHHPCFTQGQQKNPFQSRGKPGQPTNPNADLKW